MKNLQNYNVNAAINMRGQTADQLGFYDPRYNRPSFKDTVVGFRLSLEITNNDAPSFYDWGNIPYHDEILRGERCSRARWYDLHSSYRRYMSGALEERAPQYSL
jgi:hypothetical protein